MYNKTTIKISSNDIKCLIDYYNQSDTTNLYLNNILTNNDLDNNIEIQFEPLIKSYDSIIEFLEQNFFDNYYTDHVIELYQSLFREMENLYTKINIDERYNFLLVIPVADRPQQLYECLDSLLNLCHLYHYGGYQNSRFKKVKVIIADDSKKEESISKHQELATLFTKKGLEVYYYGIIQQLSLINELPDEEYKKLEKILGKINPDQFYHKGQSNMRNLIHLLISKKLKPNKKTLMFSIDSDQEFRVKVQTKNGLNQDLYIVNYLYYINKLFTENPILLLTGKVVGDPPVSPSVMTNNFIDDLIGFIKTIKDLDPESKCHFHQISSEGKQAGYHDMAQLFGFEKSKDYSDYQCTLEDTHNNRDCFIHLMEKIHGFFYGEHPTRKTFYQYSEMNSSIQTARTIYTGNYTCRLEGLQYYIPFSKLKLRMSGPVLGRIIRTELNHQFISANVPMLHKRTMSNKNINEFRPGIEQTKKKVDLSGEFERQFFGDVMLFTMEKLTDKGFPEQQFQIDKIKELLQETTNEMTQLYKENLRSIQEKIIKLKSIVKNPDNWWNQNSKSTEAVENLNQFISNVETNFDTNSINYQLIYSDDKHEHFLNIMSKEIFKYPEERKNWNDLINLDKIHYGSY